MFLELEDEDGTTQVPVGAAALRAGALPLLQGQRRKLYRTAFIWLAFVLSAMWQSASLEAHSANYRARSKRQHFRRSVMRTRGLKTANRSVWSTMSRMGWKEDVGRSDRTR